MTREEAIKFLTLMRKAVSNFEEYGHDKASMVIECDKAEAIDMAIEALQTDAVQGEWVDWLGKGNEWECSVCKCSIESHGSIAYKYCPMCGARMKGGDDIDEDMAWMPLPEPYKGGEK